MKKEKIKLKDFFGMFFKVLTDSIKTASKKYLDLYSEAHISSLPLCLKKKALIFYLFGLLSPFFFGGMAVYTEDYTLFAGLLLALLSFFYGKSIAISYASGDIVGINAKVVSATRDKGIIKVVFETEENSQQMVFKVSRKTNLIMQANYTM